MTGSTDLSVEQLQTLHHEITRHENLIRVVMHPAALSGKDVIVETHSITHGDVVVGHFYLRRSGERMTKAEYEAAGF